MKGDDAKNRSTVELMKTYLGQKYLNAVVSQAEKFTEECRFTPDLKLTQNYNRQVNPRPSRQNREFYTRTVDWNDRRENRLIEERKNKKREEQKDCQFKPEIRQMRIAPQQNSNAKKYRQSPNIIPIDTDENRESFKKVPGVTKFLQRQFCAMCDREEVKLKRENLGRSSTLQKTFHDVVKDGFAYTKVKKRRDGSLVVQNKE